MRPTTILVCTAFLVLWLFADCRAHAGCPGARCEAPIVSAAPSIGHSTGGTPAVVKAPAVQTCVQRPTACEWRRVRILRPRCCYWR